MADPDLGWLERFRRRRRYILDRELQLSLVGVSLAHVLFVLCLAAVCLFGPAAFTLLRSDPSSTDGQDAARTILYLHRLYWPAGLLAIIAVCLDSIRVSHRIAGPLYRFRRVLEDVYNGRSAYVRLRHGDFLQKEAQRINLALSELDRRRALQADGREAVTRVMQELQTSAQVEDRCDPKQLRDFARSLQQALQLLDQSSSNEQSEIEVVDHALEQDPSSTRLRKRA
jgi:hypothetical protein